MHRGRGLAEMPEQLTVKKRKISARLFLFRILIVLLLTLITAEIAMHLGYLVFRPGITVSTLIEEEYNLTRHVMAGRRSNQPNVLHPYVGFVVDPTQNQKFNSYGFWQIDGPLLHRTSDTINVGITGGSVARDLCEFSAETLRKRLALKFPGKEIKIVCLAQEGFREPQLAMTLSYFQTLGAEFDVVVSLSGFNEAVLHPAESLGDELWVGYPRAWDVRLTDTEDPEVNRLIWEGQTLQHDRMSCAVAAYRLRHLPLLTVHGIWSAFDAGYRHRLMEATSNLARARLRIMERYANVGPRIRYASDEARRTAQIDMWCGGARQQQRLCKSSGASFLLCLQPNLHDSDGKPLTWEEERLKQRGSVYQEWVEKNYTHFATAGASLKDEGVAFFDLRNLYDGNPSLIYRDECCHFSQTGSDLLATRIGDLIHAELEKPTPSP
jgi:hypothetical protein